MLPLSEHLDLFMEAGTDSLDKIYKNVIRN